MFITSKGHCNHLVDNYQVFHSLYNCFLTFMKRVKVISSSDTQTTQIDSLETDGRVDGFAAQGRRGRGGHVR